MNLINIKEYIGFTYDNPIKTSDLPVCALIKTFHKPLGDNDVIYLLEILGISTFPNSFIDIITNYQFNTLRIGNVTFGEIPNAHAYGLQWLININKKYSVGFENLKEHNRIIVSETEKNVIVMNITNGIISVLPQDLNLKAEFRIAENFTDFINYLLTAVVLTSTSQVTPLSTMMTPKFRDESMIFWQSVFYEIKSQNILLN